MFFNTTLFLIVTILLIFCDGIFERFKLPMAAVAILLGMLIGPYGFDVIDYGQNVKLLAELAVVVILFSAAYEIRWSRFIAAIKPGILVGVAGIVLSVVLGFLASYSQTERLDEALYIGIALAATSIGLSVPVLHKAGMLDSKVGQILLAAAIVDDILALYLLSAAHLGLTTNNGLGLVLYSLTLSLLMLSVLCGAVWCLKTLLYKTVVAEMVWARRLVALIMAMSSAWISHRFGLSPVVGGFAAGMMFSLSRDESREKDSRYFDNIADNVAPLFFLSVGLQITGIDFDKAEVLAYSILVVAAAIVGKLFCPWVIPSMLPIREKYLLGVSLLPRGEVGLIVASIGLQQAHISDHGMIALVSMTLVTALISSVFIPVLSKQIDTGRR